MARVIQPIDYVTKDYDGFKAMMLEKIPQICPEWTDTSESDFGIVMLELMCYGLDILAFYQDKAVNETLLPTARTKKNVIDICKSLGYRLKSQSPAKFKLIVKKDLQFINSEVVIVGGTLVSTKSELGDPIIFEFDNTLTLPAGVMGDEKDINGDYIYYAYVTHGMSTKELVAKATGQPKQRYYLNSDSILVDTMHVWTEEYNVVRNWIKVDDFLTSINTDRHYVVDTDEMGRTYVEFGDGTNGAVPLLSSPVFATYRIGGGTVGNVPVGSITDFVQEEYIEIDTITNPEPPYIYGVNRESIDRAKQLAPKLFRANDRAVTVDDFEAIACTYPNVIKAKCIETFNSNSDLYIYVAVNGYTGTSAEFKTALRDYLDSKSIVGNNIAVFDATMTPFDVSVNVTTYEGLSNAEVKSKIEDKLNTILHSDNFDFGSSVNRSRLIKELMLLDEVYEVLFTTPSEGTPITSTNTSILKLNTLTVNVTGGVD